MVLASPLSIRRLAEGGAFGRSPTASLSVVGLDKTGPSNLPNQNI
jgi:hypothetical protein